MPNSDTNVTAGQRGLGWVENLGVNLRSRAGPSPPSREPDIRGWRDAVTPSYMPAEVT